MNESTDTIELATFSFAQRDIQKRRCTRCSRIFTGLEEWQSKCYYHPGTFKEPTTYGVREDYGWSCCKKSLYPQFDVKEWAATQDIPSVKDAIDEQMAKFFKQYIALLNQQRLIGSSTIRPEHESLLAVSRQEEAPKKKFIAGVAKLDQKAPDQSLTANERCAHKDDPLLSPLSKCSVGCRITESHVLDEAFAKALEMYPLSDSISDQLLYQRMPTPEEIVQERLAAAASAKASKTKSLGNGNLLTYYPSSSQPENVETQEWNPFKDPSFAFPITTQAPAQPEKQHSDASDSDDRSANEDKEEGENEEEEVPPYYYHQVTTKDTLFGLALKYSVSVDEIQRINFLTGGHQIWHRKTLKIPSHGRKIAVQSMEPPTKAEIIRDFRKRCGCPSNEEARFYLEEAGFNVTEALEKFRQDSKWAAMNEQKFKTSTPVRSQQQQQQEKGGLGSAVGKMVKGVLGWQ